MIHIILGPDYAMAIDALRALRQSADPTGDSTSRIDGRTATITAVKMDIASVGFFSAGRVVIVDDLIARLGKQGAKDGGSTPDWSGLFAAVPDSNTLVLLDPSLRDLPAAISKALPKSAHVTRNEPPRGPDLVRWVSDRIKRQGGSVDQQATQHLLDTLYPQSWRARNNNPAYDRPPDMEMLGNEIDKLVLAAVNGAITRDVVDQMVSRGADDQVFAFLNAAVDGNVRAAISELDKLIAAGEDPAKLLAQLDGNLELMSVIANAGSANPTTIGKDLSGVSAARINALRRSSGSSERSAARIRSAATADRAMKTGRLRDPLDALYDTVLAIAGARAQ